MTTFRLLFSYRDKFHHSDEIIMRGYLNAVVEINQTHFYEICFYSYDLVNGIIKNGGSIGEPGLIVIPEVKKEIMEKTVKELHSNSMFFHGLKEYPAEKYKNYKEAIF